MTETNSLKTQQAKRKKIEVKTDGGNFLFIYDIEKHQIEIHKRGEVYQIPLLDLVEFGRTSERKVFRVIQSNHIHIVEDEQEIVRQEFE